MQNLLCLRIDDRLLHGQVGVTWANTLGANLIIVANDQVANDPVQQSLMEMVVSDEVGIRFFSIDKTIASLPKASPRQQIFIVCKSPADALRLIEGGVKIETINVGNIHNTEEGKRIHRSLALTDLDIKAFNSINKLGVRLEVQGIPTEKPIDLMSLIMNLN